MQRPLQRTAPRTMNYPVRSVSGADGETLAESASCLSPPQGKLQPEEFPQARRLCSHLYQGILPVDQRPL